MINIKEARQMLDWADGDPSSDSAFIGRAWVMGHFAQVLDELEKVRK